MKIHNLTLAAITCAMVILSACSNDVSQVYEQVEVQTFDSKKNFPDCEKYNQGEMAMSKKEGIIYYCIDSAWVQMVDQNTSNANGKDGKDGEDKRNGENGKNGEDCADGNSCNAKKTKDGIEVSCDGKVVGTLTNGKDGEDWKKGEDVKDGENGKKGEDVKDGENGKKGEDVKDGEDEKNDDDGKNGENGKDVEDGKNTGNEKDGEDKKNDENEKNGEDGADGNSCNAKKTKDGIEVSCDGIVIGTLTNEKDGDDGKDSEDEKNGEDGKDCENGKMPIVAISVDPDYFENYINAKPCKPDPCDEAKFWEDVEMPVYVEYFPDGSFSTQPAFSINAGIKISGGYSRNQDKKSVTIVMRKQYEKGRIEYPLFETRPENSRFKSFILRNNGNRYVSDYFIDAMGGALLEGSGVDYQRSRLVVVYYNGIYHGIYDMREKQNEHFIENNHGVNADDVNIIKHVHDKINEKSGSSKGYEKLLKFAAENDFSDTNSKPYIEIGKMMDLSNYADYMAAEIYFHNGDWPQNNVRAWSSTNQPWRFMVYDLDHGFDGTWAVPGFSQKINMVQWIMQGGAKMRPCYDNANEKCFHTLFVKLIKNPDFKRMFLNHASVLYSKFVNNKNASNIINKMYSTLDLDEVVRDLEQFPRAKYTNSCGSGFSIDGSCVKQWTKNRDEAVWMDLKNGLNLGKTVQVEFESSKNGNVYIEDILLPASGLKGSFFEDNKILIKAEAESTHEFLSWVDGSTENPRLVTPKQGLKIKAQFR